MQTPLDLHVEYLSKPNPMCVSGGKTSTLKPHALNGQDGLKKSEKIHFLRVLVWRRWRPQQQIYGFCIRGWYWGILLRIC
jgi:hypothetical protein